jgi:hypothetical protein
MMDGASGANNIDCQFAWNPTLNTDYHITGTYNGSKDSSGITLYLDGIDVSESRFNNGTYVGMTNTTSSVVVGARGWSLGTGTTNHKTDEVIIWDKELTPTEVLDLATVQLSGTDINP